MPTITTNNKTISAMGMSEAYFNGIKAERIYVRDKIIFQSDTYSGSRNIYTVKISSLASSYTKNITLTSVNTSGYTDWGDGTIDTKTTHTYNTIGEYTIFTDHYYYTANNSGSGTIDTRLINVKKLTAIAGVNCTNMFNGATYLTDATCTVLGNGGAISSMFRDCSRLVNVNLTAENVNSTYYTFAGCSALQGFNSIKLSNNITNTSYMFMDCVSLNKIENVIIPTSTTTTSYMFSGCRNLQNIDSLVIPDKVTDCTYMFNECTSIQNINNLIIPASVTKIDSMFNGCAGLLSVNNMILRNTIRYAIRLFANCTNLQNISTLQIGSLDCSYMFFGCGKLNTVPIMLNTITKCDYMFNNCISLTTAAIIPTSVIRCTCMFLNCTGLTTLPQENIDLFTTHSSTLVHMSCYQGCTGLTTPAYSSIPADWK